MNCKHCGAEVADDSVFCENCGAKIGGGKNPLKGNKNKLLWIGGAIVLVIVAIVAIVLSRGSTSKAESIFNDLNSEEYIRIIPESVAFRIVDDNSIDETDVLNTDVEMADNIRIKNRNCLMVTCSKDRALVNGTTVSLDELKSQIKSFLGNPENRDNYAEKRTKRIDGFAGTDWYEFPVSQGVVVINRTPDVTNNAYFEARNTIEQAIYELRDELSYEIYSTSFRGLTDKSQSRAIREAIPLSVIELAATVQDNQQNKTKATSEKSNEGNSDNEVYIIPDVEPSFEGGENGLYQYLTENIVYPSEARDNGIVGKVYVSFTVEKDGSVSDVNIMRDIGYGCGEEGVRVVRGMSGMWHPGKVGGRPVRSKFTLPINFNLK